MPFRTHARVDQDLGHGILGRLGFFLLVGLIHTINEIFRVVVGNELQRVRYAFNQIVLADYGGHRRLISLISLFRVIKNRDAKVYQKIALASDSTDGEAVIKSREKRHRKKVPS